MMQLMKKLSKYDKMFTEYAGNKTSLKRKKVCKGNKPHTWSRVTEHPSFHPKFSYTTKVCMKCGKQSFKSGIEK